MKNLILILTLFFSIPSIAQENHSGLKELDSLALKMFDDVNSKNFNSLLDMTHPKLFDILPKETMLEVFKSMFKGNEEFSINIPEIVNPKYKISKLFTNKDKTIQYAFISYNLAMTMTFNNQEFDDEAQEMMTSIMKTQGMNVKFTSNNTIDALLKNSISIFIKDEHTNSKWKMLNYDADSPLLYQVLPSEIIENVKSYKQDLMLEDKKELEKE